MSMNKLANKLSSDVHIADNQTSSYSATGPTNFSDRKVAFAHDPTVGSVPLTAATQGPIITSAHEHDHHHKHDHHDSHHHDSHHHDVNVTKVNLPVTVDHRTVVADTVVEETIRRDLLVQVQPVIHKEIEKEEVHHIVKHINEAPAPSVAGSVTLAPVVQEHVHTHVVEEIHPVIHREIVVQEVERVEKHVTEHVVVPTRHVHEVVTENVIAPVHVHTASCRHDVPREAYANVILPGTTGLPSSHVEVVDRHHVDIVDRRVVEPLVPIVPVQTVHHNTVVSEVVLKPGQEVILEKNHLTGNTVIVEKHDKHGRVIPANAHVVEEHHDVHTTHANGHAVEAGHKHHFHLPHFLGGHKKEEHVVDHHAVDTKHHAVDAKHHDVVHTDKKAVVL